MIHHIASYKHSDYNHHTLTLFVIFLFTPLENEFLAHEDAEIITSKNRFFGFFEKVTLRAVSLEKLLRHVDFPHISEIALFIFLWLLRHFSLVVVC